MGSDKTQDENDFDQYFIDGKRVDKETWVKYNRDYQRTLPAILQRLGIQTVDADKMDYLIRDLRAMRNELAHNVITSGVAAALEANAPSNWFMDWAKTQLPDVLAQSQLKALTLFDEQKDKRENTWSARLRRYTSGLVSGLILAMLGVLVMWAMGLIGFK